jgi:hypothetical protein
MSAIRRYGPPSLLIALWIPLHASGDPQILRNIGGPIEVEGNRIRGTFVIALAQLPEGVNSTGTGGACLIADLNSVAIPQNGGACHDDDDCTELPADVTTDLPIEDQRWYSYCVKPEGQPVGRCWTKAGGAYCNKSPTAPWSLGPHPVPVSFVDMTAVFQRTGMSAIAWRVHTCLNPYNAALGKDNPWCGVGSEKDGRVDNGPPRSIARTTPEPPRDVHIQ